MDPSASNYSSEQESVPMVEIQGAKAAHQQVMDVAAHLTDGQARQPSLLADWTVGHVLTHLARQFEAAVSGETSQQYPGGPAQRAREIAAGAGRPAAVLAADLAKAIDRLETAWDALPQQAWAEGRGRYGDTARSLPELVYRRWREMVVHHVDLGLSYRPADWPAGFVEREMRRLVAGLPGRLDTGACVVLEATDTGERWQVPDGEADHRLVVADKRNLLAWLLGRVNDPGLPQINPWEQRAPSARD